MKKELITPNPYAKKLLQEIAEASKTPVMIPLDKLCIDGELYHKHLNERKVLRMARNFKPEKFSPLLVSSRKDGRGRYSIIDGHHRCMVAWCLKHTEICCYIVEAECTMHEQDLYLAANQ
jgi:hypothetical protein